MNRRTFLVVAAVALCPSIAGCLGASGERGGVDDDDDENGPDDGTDSDAGTHQFYLVNLDDDTRRVEVTVVRRGDDDPVIEGTYDIPDRRGGEFREVAAWEETYEVTVSVETGVSETFYWDAESCPSADEAGDGASELPDGSRNASVRVEPGADELSFVTDSCDEIVAGTEAPTGPAEQFEVAETD